MELQITETPYDHAFKSMLSDARGTMIYLLNELFKEELEANEICLTGRESIDSLATEKCNIGENCETSKNIADSVLRVVDWIFHVECESSANRMDPYRMHDYNAKISSILRTARTTPKRMFQGVVYLRSNSKTPDVLTLPDFVYGTPIKYPTLKVSDYSAEDIVKKRLFFLIPFYIFNYEKSFDDIQKGNKDIFEKLISDFMLFDESLKKALEEGILSGTDIRTISDAFKLVMVNLTEGHEVVRKEILDKMSETIYLDYPLKNAFNEGKAEGEAEGKAEATRNIQTLLQRIPKDSEDFDFALHASGDELEALYKKYNVLSE